MTRLDALLRIDRLAADSSLRVLLDHARDAKRLVKILSDRVIEKLLEEWIRPDPIQADRIEFFWSRSSLMLSPSNRITRLQTLGSGRFAVLTGDPFAIRWQTSPDGQPMPDVLALDGDGAEELLRQLVEWQVA